LGATIVATDAALIFTYFDEEASDAAAADDIFLEARRAR
jgi:hypothetical protein